MLLTDFRHAFRGLWRAKGFTTVAVLCLGLGIGLNTTIFSVVDGVLLKPLPYTDPDRIVSVYATNQRIGVNQTGLSYLDLQDIGAATSSFSAVTGSDVRSLTISDEGGSDRYLGAGVSWNLFQMLGVLPQLGPGFTENDGQPGAARVVILSDAVWRVKYDADPGIIGRTLVLDRVPATVVGVMPERFAFPESQKLWIPLVALSANDPRDDRGIAAFGRLAVGATLEQARSELDTVSARLEDEFPGTNADWRVTAQDLRAEFIPDDVTLVIWLMMAGVTLVLFIACSNVANLLLARASARRREIAVRAALGAGRAIIVRQLLTESVALALLAVPLGLILAEFGARAIFQAMPADQVPYYITWDVDARARAWAVGVAVGTALLFGLFPALQASRTGLHEDLKEGTRGNSARRSLLRSWLVVAQVSLALVSLVGALMFVRSFTNLDSFKIGFDPKPLMTMRMAMPGEAYEEEDARARRAQDVLDRVEALPGVHAAFASNMVPLSGGGGGGNVVIDGLPSEPGREPGVAFTGVTPHFLRALGISPVEGRDFTDAEGWARTDAALINETMATRFWPTRSAVGGRFRVVNPGLPEIWFTVVGVVPDIQRDDVDPDDEVFPAAFVSYLYQQTLNTGLTIRVVDGDPAAITSAVRGAIRASDPYLPVFQVATMEDLRRLGYWEYGIFGWVFGVIGFGGLVLAAIGVYGVLSYAVSQRVPEIGVRVALGASRRDVIRLVVGHGLWLAGIGVVVGLALAPAGTWAGRSLFYNVSPFDPLTFAAVALFLMAVAFLASYLPALRATRIDPLAALREN